MAKGKFNTEELLDRYYSTKPESTVKKTKMQIDRPELYAFEEKINKPLVQMDCFEILEMLKTFVNANYAETQYKMSYRTYDFLISTLRGFFDWYIDNVEVIKNPCSDKRIKGSAKVKYLKDDNAKTFNKDSMEELIADIRNDLITEYADYLECIIRLLYEGCVDTFDIVNIKNSDVNHKNKTITVRGRKISLSDRCYKLLVKIHKMTDYPAFRGSYVMVSCHDSYFKFPTREKYVNDDRDKEFYAGYLSRVFIKEVKTKRHLNIKARTLYLLGFYDFIVAKVGQDRAKEIIMTTNNSEYTKEILDFAHEYNLIEKNSTSIKNLLIPFVS